MARAKKAELNNTSKIVEERDTIMESANDALRDAIDWLVKWYADDAKYSLTSRWDLGQQVLEILADREENRSKRFGPQSLKAFCTFSGESKTTLRLYAKYAQTYTLDELQKISQRVMADGTTPVSFSHLRMLLSVPEKEVRDKILELVIKNCWTVDQLSKHIISMNGGMRGNSPGRSVGKPKTVTGLIRQQLAFTEDFEKRNLSVWKAPDSSLTTQLAAVPAAQYSEDLAAQLGKLAFQMKQLAEEATQRAAEAEARYNEVRAILDNNVKNSVKLASQLNVSSPSTPVITVPAENKPRCTYI